MKNLIIFVICNTITFVYAQTGRQTLFIKDPCLWVLKTDSIKIDYAIIIDSSGFVRKQKADFLVRKYEVEECDPLRIWQRYKERNEVFLLNGLPAEVMLYRPTGQQIVVSNGFYN